MNLYFAKASSYIHSAEQNDIQPWIPAKRLPPAAYGSFQGWLNLSA